MSKVRHTYSEENDNKCKYCGEVGVIEKYYRKITSVDKIVSGRNYLIVYEELNIILNGAVASGSIDSNSNSLSIDPISNSQILSTENLNKSSFVITGTTNKYKIYASAGYYIGNNGTNNKISNTPAEDSATEMSITFDADYNALICATGSTKYMGVNENWNHKKGFRFYESGTYPAVQLYMLDA